MLMLTFCHFVNVPRSNEIYEAFQTHKCKRININLFLSLDTYSRQSKKCPVGVEMGRFYTTWKTFVHL
jgi:hypothetical protein